MATVLVTGGAGYIGAHACRALAGAGHRPVAFDNLSTGWAEAVRFGPVVEGDLTDRKALDAAFAAHRPDAVMHFAALSLVGDSMADPGRYWRENVTGALTLIEAMVAAGCRRIVFSSTCATYGDQDGVLLDEEAAQRPTNAYGGSKLAIERMLHDFAAAEAVAPVIFRYFNVAGAAGDASIGEQHRPETHLIPLALDTALGRRPALTLHGTDYPTPDGTCIRDYVHVEDLIDAHLAGLARVLDGGAGDVFCLGTGHGFSVREVVSAAARVTGREVALTEGPRRAGDSASLVSAGRRAGEVLGWRPDRSTLDRMIADAWAWHLGTGFAR